MNKEKGILLIALGHKNYSRMALTLAVSLKSVSPTIPICVITDEHCFSDENVSPEEKKRWFDKIITCKREVYMIGTKKVALRTKTFAYELSPFDKTLLLDVDMIWSEYKTVESVFAELDGKGFSCINEGHLDVKSGATDVVSGYTFWADPAEIKKAYSNEGEFKTGKLYQLRTELMYFEKSEENKKYFDLVRKIFDRPRVKTALFAGFTPDEFAFNVASCIMHRYPHIEKWAPIYWHWRHHKENLNNSQLLRKYYAVSIGGRRMPEPTKKLYNIMAGGYFYKHGISSPYKPRPKREFLPERIDI